MDEALADQLEAKAKALGDHARALASVSPLVRGAIGALQSVLAEEEQREAAQERPVQSLEGVQQASDQGVPFLESRA
jgi:hypothetical protein